MLEGFEWDPAKDEINREKHGVGFAEASEVFASLSMSALDTRLAYGETRWVTIGRSRNGNVLVVAHTQRGNRIRIISARRANKKERATFYAKVQPFL
jgi:uncharacterized DUF497 family protein